MVGVFAAATAGAADLATATTGVWFVVLEASAPAERLLRNMPANGPEDEEVIPPPSGVAAAVAACGAVEDEGCRLCESEA